MRSLILTSSCLVALACPALADPALGLGLSYSFGAGGSQAGVGLRVFSNDKSDRFVADAGVDYMLNNRSFRGTVGAAYLDNNAYLGLDVGLGLKGGGMSYGLSVGAVDTRDPSSSSAPPVAATTGEALAF